MPEHPFPLLFWSSVLGFPDGLKGSRRPAGFAGAAGGGACPGFELLKSVN